MRQHSTCPKAERRADKSGQKWPPRAKENGDFELQSQINVFSNEVSGVTWKSGPKIQRRIPSTKGNIPDSYAYSLRCQIHI